MAEGAQRVHVVVEGGQAQADPARDLGTAVVREARQLGVVEDGHDAGHDGDGDTGGTGPLDEVEVGVGVVEVLGDGRVCTGRHFLGEVRQVGVGRGGLGVHLGVGRHFDGEPVAAVLAHEAHQVGGVLEVAQGHGAGGQVATQGHQALDALGAVAVQQFTDAVAGGAHAGQVRGHFRAGGGQVGDGLGGAGLGAATGAEGDAEVFGLQGLQGAVGFEQLLGAGIGGRREELEAERGGLSGHGVRGRRGSGPAGGDQKVLLVAVAANEGATLPVVHLPAGVFCTLDDVTA